MIRGKFQQVKECGDGGESICVFVCVCVCVCVEVEEVLGGAWLKQGMWRGPDWLVAARVYG